MDCLSSSWTRVAAGTPSKGVVILSTECSGSPWMGRGRRGGWGWLDTPRRDFASNYVIKTPPAVLGGPLSTYLGLIRYRANWLPLLLWLGSCFSSAIGSISFPFLSRLPPSLGVNAPLRLRGFLLERRTTASTKTTILHGVSRVSVYRKLSKRFRRRFQTFSPSAPAFRCARQVVVVVLL